MLLPLLAARETSLDASTPDVGPAIDRIASPDPSPEDSSSTRPETQSLAEDAVGRALATLNDRERMIVRERMMAEDPVTLEKLGVQLGVSKERVRPDRGAGAGEAPRVPRDVPRIRDRLASLRDDPGPPTSRGSACVVGGERRARHVWPGRARSGKEPAVAPTESPSTRHAATRRRARPAPVPEGNASKHDAGTGGEYAFPIPSGKPSSLTCADARMSSWTQQVRGNAARVRRARVERDRGRDRNGRQARPARPQERVARLADSGRPLPSRGRAAPARPRWEEGATRHGTRRAAGEAMARWVGELGTSFDAARRGEEAGKRAVTAASVRLAEEDAPFEEEAGPARELAVTLGEHVGDVERSLGPAVTPYADAARARFFPPLDGMRSGRASSSRRRFAPTCSSSTRTPNGRRTTRRRASTTSISTPTRRTGSGTAPVRTALGVRVESGPMEPLAVGDLVLAIGGVATAGLPLEQLEQLVYATTDAASSAPSSSFAAASTSCALWSSRRRKTRPREADEPPDPLPAYRVPYGGGDALVVAIHDIRSDLADELSATLRRKKREDTRPIEEPRARSPRRRWRGSTEGAIAALALFLPGAPLFPMVAPGRVDRGRPRARAAAGRTLDGPRGDAGRRRYRERSRDDRGGAPGVPARTGGRAADVRQRLRAGVPRRRRARRRAPAHDAALCVAGRVAGPGGRNRAVAAPSPRSSGPSRRTSTRRTRRTRPRRGAVPTSVTGRARVVPGGHALAGARGEGRARARDAEVCRALVALGGASSGKRPAAVLAPTTVTSGRR